MSRNHINEMDNLSSSYDRRTVNMQIDNEPGRVIGYHGKGSQGPLQLLAQNYLYIRYEKSFYISINVVTMWNIGLKSCKATLKKLANKALENRSQPTDQCLTTNAKYPPNHF